MSQKFYVKSTQVDGLPQDNKIRYHFYKNFPPPYTYGGGYKNCESYEGGGPLPL
jgi:hypothetical protein